MDFRKQTISNVQENIAYNDQEWSFCMLLSVSGCVTSHNDVANSRTQPLMSISGSTQLVGHRVDLREYGSSWGFFWRTRWRSSHATWCIEVLVHVQSVLVLHCHALLCVMHRYTVRGACMHFQHAFSSVYASFHVQSCAMCRSNMQIGYSDAPDIVIHFRKSKGHVISDIYCTFKCGYCTRLPDWVPTGSTGSHKWPAVLFPSGSMYPQWGRWPGSGANTAWLVSHLLLHSVLKRNSKETRQPSLTTALCLSFLNAGYQKYT